MQTWDGLKPLELRKIQKIVKSNCEKFGKAWKTFFEVWDSKYFPFGLWVLVHGHEYFLDHKSYPGLKVPQLKKYFMEKVLEKAISVGQH